MAAGQISRFLGKGGLKAVSQIFNLLLVSIAVSMDIRGLVLSNIIHTL